MVFTESKEKQPALPKPPQTFSLIGGAHTLAGVLDQNEPLGIAKTLDLIDTRHGSAHVNGDHRLGRRGQGRFDAFRRQAQRLVDLGKYRHRAGHEYRLDGGDKSKGRHDHLVAGPHAAGGKGCGKGCRAAGAQMGVGDADPFGQLRFKGFRFPVPLAGAIETVTKKDAGLQYVVYLLAFFFTEYFKTGHDMPPKIDVIKYVGI